MMFVMRYKWLIVPLACLAFWAGSAAIVRAQEEAPPVPPPAEEPSVVDEEDLPPMPEALPEVPVVEDGSEQGVVPEGAMSLEDVAPETTPGGDEGANAEQANNAQTASQPGLQPLQAQKPMTQMVNARRGPVFNREEYPSMLFTFWEHTAITDARRARGSTRAPTESELMRDLKTNNQEELRVKPPAEEREIKLSGILYQGSGKWTIWLNGERVTPQAIPEEVMDLKVYKEYVEFKWFDVYTNRIFPIRLRTHQRFNIDSRIFLPG